MFTDEELIMIEKVLNNESIKCNNVFENFSFLYSKKEHRVARKDEEVIQSILEKVRKM